MRVVVTGAAGFLGGRVCARLLAADSPVPVTRLVMVDAAPVTTPPSDPRVETRVTDLTAPGVARQLVEGTDLLFHLAAVVSGHAEADLDLGYKVNLDATRALLDAARHYNPTLRLVFTSTTGVFGGDLPPLVSEGTAPTPQTSYGTAKAMAELLLNDYSRRGLVDGRAVRLPTVSVRGGAANRAVTSFASGIVREPLAGVTAECPVPAEQRVWLASPGTVVHNIVHAATLPAGALGAWRVVDLPGLCVSVGDMLAALRRVAGPRVADRVVFTDDEQVARMVASFPQEHETARASRLGFITDESYDDIIRAYIRDDLKGSYVK